MILEPKETVTMSVQMAQAKIKARKCAAVFRRR